MVTGALALKHSEHPPQSLSRDTLRRRFPPSRSLSRTLSANTSKKKKQHTRVGRFSISSLSRCFGLGSRRCMSPQRGGDQDNCVEIIRTSSSLPVLGQLCWNTLDFLLLLHLKAPSTRTSKRWKIGHSCPNSLSLLLILRHKTLSSGIPPPHVRKRWRTGQSY